MAPKAKKKIYLVRDRRCLVLKAANGRGEVNWARGGEYIDLSHPMLWSDLQDQMHMLREVSKLPKGAKLKSDYPGFYDKKLRGYDRDSMAHAVNVVDLEVDTQLDEMHRTVAELQDRVDALTEENLELKEKLTMETA